MTIHIIDIAGVSEGPDLADILYSLKVTLSEMGIDTDNDTDCPSTDLHI